MRSLNKASLQTTPSKPFLTGSRNGWLLNKHIGHVREAVIEKVWNLFLKPC